MRGLTFRKRMSAITLATVIGLASVVPSVSAMSSDYVREQAMSQKQQIKIANYESDTEIDKAVLLRKLHDLFPGRFDFLTDSDLNVHQYYYPEEPEEHVRIGVNISKKLKEDHFYGDITFIGDDYYVESFYLDSPNKEGAYYPAAKSKSEIEKIARSFIEKMPNGSSYELKQIEDTSSWGGNQTLTEPITFHVTFEKKHDGIPIIGQERYMSVLGNGHIIHYYGGEYLEGQSTFESKEGIISEQAAREKFLSTVDFELQYLLYPDYSFGEMKPVLTYAPMPSIYGIKAKDGSFFNGESFVESIETTKGVKLIVNEPIKTETNSISEKEAKQIAEQLLPKTIGEWKLNIHGVYLDKWSKQEIYQVNYMYERKGDGYGGNLAIAKDTGEIVNYYHALAYIDDEKGSQNVSREQAEIKAVEAIKTYLPTQAHLYSYPIERVDPIYSIYRENERGIHYFNFPMVKNGVIVRDGVLSIEISSKDGSLVSLNRPMLEEGLVWADPKNAIDKEKATKALEEALTLKLVYTQLYNNDSNQYYLMYQPQVSEEQSFFDAISGKWMNMKDDKKGVDIPGIKGHWAEKEIRYLTEAKILTAIDGLAANKEVTKAAALEVVMKSIESFSDYPYYYNQDQKPTFANIDKEHPLFKVVERAVSRGVLTGKESLNLNETITREELAVWYIRGLGLEKVAKHEKIFKLPFKDSNSVSKDKVGYIALANAYEIFIGDKDGKFNPKRNATLGELAVSSFKYGKKASELIMDRYY